LKKNFLIITSYNSRTGFGNFIRSGRFFYYLKKKYNCKFYVKTKDKNLKSLKKIYSNIELLDLKKIKIFHNTFIFLDMPNLTKSEYNIFKRGKLICYGNNNYFNHPKNIIPFSKNSINHNIKFAITDNNFKKIKYSSFKEMYFFIYLSTSIKKEFLKKLLRQIRTEFSNKIVIYLKYKGLKFFNNIKNLKFTKNINQNYLKDNMIFIGNLGSGSIDRASKGIMSLTFSKNLNEKKIYNSLKRYHKNLFYFGDINNFHHKKFCYILKKLKKTGFPHASNLTKKFKNNNLNLERKIISLYQKSV